MLIGLPVEISPVSLDLPNAAARGVLWQAAPGRFLLAVPQVARYLVTDGQRLTIDPDPAAAEADITRFALMAPLAALLYQRGQLAFHAAACLPPGGEAGAILLAGDSGAGKSTLLAALLQRGWRMLADDLAAVEVNGSGPPLVRATPAPLRLWPDAQEKLGPYPEPPDFESRSALTPPLRAIYWLTVHSGNAIETEALTGAARFRALGALLYNSHIAAALLDKAAYLSRAGRLAQTVPLIRLRRPRGQWSVADLLDKIEPAKR